MNLLIGLVVGAILGWIAYRRRTVTKDGWGVCALSMAITCMAGGWVWAIPLLVYLISSDLWPRLGVAYKRLFVAQYERSYTHNGIAILSRVGWALGLAILALLTKDSQQVLVPFVGALATSYADLMATEIGLLGARPPRVITTGRRAAPGAPGAISIQGLVAGFGGAWLVGLVTLLGIATSAWVRSRAFERSLLWLPLVGALGGTMGSLVDSLLGSTSQGMYECERCGKILESRKHLCEGSVRQVRGWAWLDNNGVNLVSTAVGAALAAGVFAWLAQTHIWW
jgi:uncharacterized protein (TIGR00297 family)